MDLFCSLLSIFVFTVALIEPTTNSENLTPIVPGYKLSDRQFENASDFSQVSRVSLAVDNYKVSTDMGGFTKRHDGLDFTKETTVIQTTNTLRSEVETVEHIQLYTTDTFLAGTGHLNKGYNVYNVTTDQDKLGTLTPQSERNTTVWNDTLVLQMENMPLYAATTLLKLTTIMVILLGTALITASMWRIWSNYFRSLPIEYNIKYTMQYSNEEFLTVEYHDTVTV
ncbi:uncharacterized protein LOC124723181 [Schistocerca piceifrons]|uniref:uncharacterized protein LOC124723181 n=1 Tax=Schistocerca piceifrons TaxID=274613 RepID=UPI001F5F2FD6|nr:uncharacterized protein LOC124723181 [Schistocerca piceifrons]